MTSRWRLREGMMRARGMGPLEVGAEVVEAVEVGREVVGAGTE